jgi:hypothetical protein
MRSESFKTPAYYFPAKPQDINALIRRTRPFHTREIRDIALTPAATRG